MMSIVLEKEVSTLKPCRNLPISLDNVKMKIQECKTFKFTTVLQKNKFRPETNLLCRLYDTFDQYCSSIM